MTSKNTLPGKHSNRNLVLLIIRLEPPYTNAHG
jgi:hypothetical protein